MSSEKTIGRGSFMKIMTIGGLATGAALLLSSCNFEQAARDEQVANNIATHIVNQFGLNSIRFLKSNETFHDHTNVEAMPFGYSEATTTMENIYNSLCKYPPSFFENITDLNTQLIIGSELETLQEDNTWARIGGTVFYDGGVQIVMPSSMTAQRTSVVIDHEFFHGVTDNSPQLVANPFFIDVDKRLQSVNAKYGLVENVYKNYNEAAACGSTHNPGFARCYGAWNTNEDGAVIAEKLLNGDREIYRNSVTDKPLKEKVLAIMDVYREISGGKMNEEYFGKLSNGQAEGVWGWPSIPAEVYNV